MHRTRQCTADVFPRLAPLPPRSFSGARQEKKRSTRGTAPRGPWRLQARPAEASTPGLQRLCAPLPLPLARRRPVQAHLERHAEELIGAQPAPARVQTRQASEASVWGAWWTRAQQDRAEERGGGRKPVACRACTPNCTAAWSIPVLQGAQTRGHTQPAGPAPAPLFQRVDELPAAAKALVAQPHHVADVDGLRGAGGAGVEYARTGQRLQGDMGRRGCRLGWFGAAPRGGPRSGSTAAPALARPRGTERYWSTWGCQAVFKRDVGSAPKGCTVYRGDAPWAACAFKPRPCRCSAPQT